MAKFLRLGQYMHGYSIGIREKGIRYTTGYLSSLLAVGGSQEEEEEEEEERRGHLARE